MWAEPEHGPPPYLQTLPHTKLRPSSCLELFTKGCAPADMADLWDVNARVARQMREQHAAAVQVRLGLSPNPNPNPNPNLSPNPNPNPNPNPSPNPNSGRRRTRAHLGAQVKVAWSYKSKSAGTRAAATQLATGGPARRAYFPACEGPGHSPDEAARLI